MKCWQWNQSTRLTLESISNHTEHKIPLFFEEYDAVANLCTVSNLRRSRRKCMYYSCSKNDVHARWQTNNYCIHGRLWADIKVYSTDCMFISPQSAHRSMIDLCTTHTSLQNYSSVVVEDITTQMISLHSKLVRFVHTRSNGHLSN